MSISQKLINFIEKRRSEVQKNQSGPFGDFWRNGGNDLLFDLPVKTGGLIIDAGGYKGDWSAGMIARYGCRSEIFEPVPEFYNHCLKFFEKNKLVRVHGVALGGNDRLTKFTFSDNGTSEHKNSIENFYIDVKVMNIDRFFSESVSDKIDCFKMNIEGGEYELIERLIESKK